MDCRHRPKEIVNSPGQLADDQVYSPSLLAEIKCNSPRLLPLCRGGGIFFPSKCIINSNEWNKHRISFLNDLSLKYWTPKSAPSASYVLITSSEFLIAMFLWTIVGSIYKSCPNLPGLSIAFFGFCLAVAWTKRRNPTLIYFGFFFHTRNLFRFSKICVDHFLFITGSRHSKG